MYGRPNGIHYIRAVRWLMNPSDKWERCPICGLWIDGKKPLEDLRKHLEGDHERKYTDETFKRMIDSLRTIAR